MTDLTDATTEPNDPVQRYYKGLGMQMSNWEHRLKGHQFITSHNTGYWFDPENKTWVRETS